MEFCKDPYGREVEPPIDPPEYTTDECVEDEEYNFFTGYGKLFIQYEKENHKKLHVDMRAR